VASGAAQRPADRHGLAEAEGGSVSPRRGRPGGVDGLDEAPEKSSGHSPVESGARLDAAFERVCDRIALLVDRHLVEQLLRASHELGADFESLVLWGVLSHANVDCRLQPDSASTSPPEAPPEAPAPPGERRPVRASDLARLTGIPRETVRRKLLSLEAAGRARHVASGWVADAGACEPALKAFHRHSMLRLLAAARDVEEALRRGLRMLEAEAGQAQGAMPSGGETGALIASDGGRTAF
jgi:hypothetical protein